MYELQSNSSTSTRQQLYYILDQFDGWLLGPSTGLNLGGVKNSHDSMCVTESGRARWEYNRQISLVLISQSNAAFQ